MTKNNLISLQHLCSYYHAEIAFVQSLQEYGLIEFTTVEEEYFVSEEQVKEVERMIHLHYDLNINVEGIDVIQRLMRRLDDLNKEFVALKNRLDGYE